jgi:hypothetical protein
MLSILNIKMVKNMYLKLSSNQEDKQEFTQTIYYEETSVCILLKLVCLLILLTPLGALLCYYPNFAGNNIQLSRYLILSSIIIIPVVFFVIKQLGDYMKEYILIYIFMGSIVYIISVIAYSIETGTLISFEEGTYTVFQGSVVNTFVIFISTWYFESSIE